MTYGSDDNHCEIICLLLLYECHDLSIMELSNTGMTIFHGNIDFRDSSTSTEIISAKSFQNYILENYRKSPRIGRTFLLPILPLKIQCGLSTGTSTTGHHVPSHSHRLILGWDAYY